MSILKNRKVRYGWGYVVREKDSLNRVMVYNKSRDKLRILVKTIITGGLSTVIVMGAGTLLGFGWYQPMIFGLMLAFATGLLTFDANNEEGGTALHWSPVSEVEIDAVVKAATSGAIEPTQLEMAIIEYKADGTVNDFEQNQ